MVGILIKNEIQVFDKISSAASFSSYGRSVSLFAGFTFFFSETQPRPNIIIVSFCSLAKRYLSIYNSNVTLTPEFKKFSENSLIFENAYSSFPFFPLRYQFFYSINSQFLEENHYHLNKDLDDGFFLRIPALTDKKYVVDIGENVHQVIQPINEAIQTIKTLKSPYYLNVLIKYLHFPLYDQSNKKFLELAKLNTHQKKLLDNYQRFPQNYPEKLPFFAILFNDIKTIERLIKTKKPLADGPHLSVFSVATDTKLLESWRKSKGYLQDLELLQTLYKSKLSFFDSLLKPLFDELDFQIKNNNAIVILETDHGQMLMERGEYGHANVSLYDEALESVFVVKTNTNSPESTTIRIPYQINKLNLEKYLMGLIRGKLSVPDFRKTITAPAFSEEYIVSRSCSLHQYSVRKSNRWKLIVQFNNSQKKLFDLINDPGETANVYQENIVIGLELEDYLNQHLSDFEQKSNIKPVGYCTW